MVKAPFWNSRRLRDYPRLMFIAIWIILLFNLVFRQGWMGALNQVIGSDFITLYAAGLAFRTGLHNLYNLTTQFEIQQSLIQPTLLSGVNPFISPPYVAQVYSIFTHLPLSLAFILWTLLSIVFTFGSLVLLHRWLPEAVKRHLPLGQVAIIVFSFFPFIEGIQVGQNHALTMLLVTGVLVFIISEKWLLAGVMAGLLIYKPQLVIGLLVIWLIWRKYQALGAFSVTALVWAGTFWLVNGFGPYQMYLDISRDLFLLPYIEGFPAYLLTTFYGLLTTLFPIGALPVIRILTIIFAGIALLILTWLAYMYRNRSMLEKTPIIVLAMLVPLLAFPYTLLHDMVIVIPAFFLWARYSLSPALLKTVIAVYLSGFFLTLLAALIKVALFPLLLIGITSMVIFHSVFKMKAIVMSEAS